MELATEVNSSENTNPDSITAPTTVKPPTNYVADPTARFRGIGINFRAKLIGIDEVLDSRGDQMCQESLLKLKAAVKASGQHKQKVVVNVSLEGIKVIDQLSGQVEHVHPVHRISFISRDLTDRRAFGYVYGVGDGNHQFFGIKTQKIAESLVLSLRDLFQVVYNMKKKEMETSKEHEVVNEKQTITTTDQKEAPQQGGLLDLQTQLNSLQDGIATIDAIQPWDNGPTTPDAGFPGNDSNGDMFGANLSDISSLSSEFSCASNTIIDYGYAGGGRGGNNFVRTGSSTSSRSKSGLSRSSDRAKPLNETEEIKEEHEAPSHHSSGTGSDMFGSKNSIKVPSEDGSSFFSEVMTAAGLAETSNDLASTTDDKHKDNLSRTSSTGETSSIDSKSHKSSKKHSAFSGLFKSKSERSKKKRKSKKHSEMASSASSIASKSEEEKGNLRTLSMSAQLRTSSTSLSTHSTPTRNHMLTINNSKNLERTTSSHSVNSVQSCSPVVTTSSMVKGHSSQSLEPAPSVIKKQKSLEHIKSATAAAIELKKSSLVPRARPNVKHKATPAEENPKNPPMFKSKHSSNEDVSKTSTVVSSPVEFKADWERLEEEAFADFKAEFPKDNDDTVEDEQQHCDPFTGLSNDDNLKASNSFEGFTDSAWADGEKADVDDGKVTNNLFPLSEEDPFADDPFKDETVDNIHDVIEKGSPDPFEKVDPFALDMNDNETIFADPFENINIEDPFQDLTDQTITEDTVNAKFDDYVFSSDDMSNREPTFPQGSEDFIARKKSLKDGVDSSSVTSGLSTPIHDPSSPAHKQYSSDLSDETPIPLTPPPLPPRLPPRRKKTIEEDDVDIACPNVPPPPLPDDIVEEDFENDEETEEDDNILPPSFSPPDLPPTAKLDVNKINDNNPPAIPKRRSSLQSDDVSWKHCFIEVPALILPPSSEMLRSKNLMVLPNAPKREDYSSGSSGSSLWPDSTTSSEDRSSTGSNQNSGASSNMQQSDSYASDLLALNQTAQAAPGSKLTNDQILDGFKSGQPTGMGGMGMPQQGFGAPQPGYGMQQGGYGQPNAMGMPQQQAFGMQPNIQGGFNNQMQSGFGAQPGFNAGGFQQPQMAPPRRAAPPQPGHMGGTPNPFGDSMGAPTMFPDNSLLTPKSNKPEPENKEEKQGNDPFADLVGGMGSKSNSKKDMFKDFQMSKPKPPARTSVNASPQEDTEKSTSSKFDNFMFNNVGGIPLQTEDEANNNKAPTPAPRQPAAPANDPFGFDISGGNATENKAADPFGGGMGGFDQAFDFGGNANNNSNQAPAVNNTNNFDSLFG